MPPAKLNRLLGIPILGGIVRRKVLKALGLDQCRIAAGGAAPMPMALLQWYSKLGLNINEGYGMTENLAVSHITVPGKNQQGTVGPAYEGVEHRIDPRNRRDPDAQPGADAGLLQGAREDPEAMTDDGWLRTGDKGQIDDQGLLRITGRVKDLFKTGKGKYVAPAPIEDKLVMHEAVEACVVTGANLGQPLGIVMLNADSVARLADRRARSELEQSLAAHLKTHQRHARPARAAAVHRGRDHRLDGGQRHHHADLQGQAQPHRGPVRALLRGMGVRGRKVLWLDA